MLDVKKESEVWYAVYKLACDALGQGSFFSENVRLEGEDTIEDAELKGPCPECKKDITLKGSVTGDVELEDIITVSSTIFVTGCDEQDLEALRDLALKRSVDLSAEGK